MSGENQAKSRKGTSGLLFVGCLLISLAVGLLTGTVAVSLLAGLGVGFFAMAIGRAVTGEW